MGSFRAFAASRYRRPDFPSVCRVLPRRCNTSASSTTNPSPARSSSPCSTRIGSPIIRTWSRRYARLNIRAELYLGNPRKLGNQLKYADKRNAPCVVIQGSDEKAKGEVTIKDLIVGAELAKLEKGREEHLQKQAEAQRSVPETELVATVRNLLARHGIS